MNESYDLISNTFSVFVILNMVLILPLYLYVTIRSLRKKKFQDKNGHYLKARAVVAYVTLMLSIVFNSVLVLFNISATLNTNYCKLSH